MDQFASTIKSTATRFSINLTNHGSALNSETPTKVHNFSKSPAKGELKLLETRKTFQYKHEFLFLGFSYAIGIGNILQFPLLILGFGGLTSCFPLLFCCILMTIPSIFMKMAVGQFLSKGIVSAFDCVPILKGLGWSNLLLTYALSYVNVSSLIFYLNYFFYSFEQKAYNSCGASINSNSCITPRDNCSNAFESSKILSTFEFDTALKENFELYYNPKNYLTFSGKNFIFILFYTIVFFVLLLRQVFGIQLLKFISLLMPTIFIFVLVYNSWKLPGSSHGIKLLIQPELDKITSFEGYVLALKYTLASTKAGSATWVSLASLNKFHYNFYYDPIYITIVDLFYCLSNALYTFPIIGYLTKQCDTDINKIKESLTSGKYSILSVILFGLSKTYHSKFLAKIYFLTIILFAIDTAVLELINIIITITDIYPNINRTSWKRLLLVSTVCLLNFFLNLLLCTSLSGNMIFQLETAIYFILGFSNFLHLSIVVYIYGVSHLRSDIKMMLGFNISTLLIIIMSSFSPILSLVILVPVTIVSNYHTKIYNLNVLELCVIFLTPPLIYSVWRIIYYKRYERSENAMKIFFKPTKFWGPYYKRHWLLNHTYRSKLARYHNDKEFFDTLDPSENIKEIIDKLIDLLRQGIRYFNAQNEKNEIQNRRREEKEWRNLKESEDILSKLSEDMLSKLTTDEISTADSSNILTAPIDKENNIRWNDMR